MKKLTVLLIIVILLSCNKNISEIAANQEVLFPNGNPFHFLEDHTNYKKIYYVDQNNQKASDQNQGTEASPFKTINQAAQVIMPGEKVIVKKGIYRENIRPPRGGENEKAMICYRSHHGVLRLRNARLDQLAG